MRVIATILAGLLLTQCGRITLKGNSPGESSPPITGSLAHTTVSFDPATATLTVTESDPAFTLYVTGSSLGNVAVAESADGPWVVQDGVRNLSVTSAGDISLGSLSLEGNISVTAGANLNLVGDINTK